VYDPYGHPHQWTDRQRTHWIDILENAKRRAGVTGEAQVKDNWTGFTAKAATARTAEQRRSLDSIRERIRANRAEIDAHQQVQVQARGTASADRASVNQVNEARRQARAERMQQAREQRAAQAEARSESRGSVREAISEHRRARRGGGGGE
jgi:hypothetical protein